MKKRSGFTLVELFIVIAIVMVGGGVVIQACRGDSDAPPQLACLDQFGFVQPTAYCHGGVVGAYWWEYSGPVHPVGYHVSVVHHGRIRYASSTVVVQPKFVVKSSVRVKQYRAPSVVTSTFRQRASAAPSYRSSSSFSYRPSTRSSYSGSGYRSSPSSYRSSSYRSSYSSGSSYRSSYSPSSYRR